MPLLDAEGGVEIERQLEEGAERPEDREEGEAGGDRAEAEGPRDPARTGLDDAEAARRQERERDHDLHPAVDEAEAVPVARVGDRLGHLVLADAEGPARFREAGRVEGVAAVQAREGGLDDLLREAKEEE